jgi:UDP-N-acetylglucosamine 1-carboxyvinyltransferase
MRVDCGMTNGSFEVRPSKPQAARRITTGLWPSFPSDLVSLVTVLATQAEGRTLVHDWMYELRLFALEQMSGMGADLFLADAHRIIVQGPTKLRGGRMLDSRDLRSGMSLIAAGLAAEGQTRVTPLETVERGYSQLVARLEDLGAQCRGRLNNWEVQKSSESSGSRRELTGDSSYFLGPHSMASTQPDCGYRGST